VTGLYGGAFDPPHNGHVALAAGAKQAFAIPRLIVLVSESPGHKSTHSPAQVRLELARAAFPNDDVRLDPYPRTIDLLRAHPEWNGPVFLIGADQFRSFLAWKEPDGILELAELAVGARPGFPRERLDTVLDRLRRPERVQFFEIEPNRASSTAIRAGEPAQGLVPPAVASLIRQRALYTDS